MHELTKTLEFLDRQHSGARVFILTGSGHKAFAAGADIKEMAPVGYSEVRRLGLFFGV